MVIIVFILLIGSVAVLYYALKTVNEEEGE